MLKHLRAFVSALLRPIALLLLRLGLTPNAVTIIGTIGVSLGALLLFPTGNLLLGSIVICCFIFSDLIDGLMARLGRQQSPLGGFLDSVCDRIQDSALFFGLLLLYYGHGDNRWAGAAAAICMVLGLLVSYIRARAESEGYDANTGIAERPERIALTLAATLLVGAGAPEAILAATLTLLAAGSLITIIQRITTVARQASRAAVPTTDAEQRT